MLNQLINDFNADARAITGQTDNIGFYLYQTGGTYVSQAEATPCRLMRLQLDITSRRCLYGRSHVSVSAGVK